MSAKAQASSPEAGAPKALGNLTRLGFTSAQECALCIPTRYKDLRQPAKALRGLVGEQLYVELRVLNVEVYSGRGDRCSWGPMARRLVLWCLDDEAQTVQVAVFGAIWDWHDFKRGHDLHLFGTVAVYEGQLQVNAPVLVEASDRGRMVAEYTGRKRLVKGPELAQAVREALQDPEEAERALAMRAGMRAQDIARLAGFGNCVEFLRALHMPASPEEAEKAQLAARRLTVESIVRKSWRNRERSMEPRSSLAVRSSVVEALIKALPYRLTADQRRAIDEICDDLRSPYPMRRLLSGDVGTGKSLAFMVPAAAAYMGGATVCIIAPSTLVVEQLARELRQLFPKVPVTTVTAGSSLGEGILVGTTALVNAVRKAGLQVDLLIADEQQKFGLGQKTELVGAQTNFLESTATAIPRTLALVQFGDMAVSTLAECPVKKKVDTLITRESDLPRMIDFFRRARDAGAQTAVIYPMVGTEEDASPEAEAERKRTVYAAAQRWERAFPGRVAVLHGRLSDEEKAAVIQGMNEQKFDILVSSIVIEVGVTLPSLKAMAVMHPERLGVNQLHQLRGRLARKGGLGRFFLHVADDLKDATMERLELLVECADGFELAERDMQLRGFGAIENNGTNQSGETFFLFWGIQPEPVEIAEAAKRMGML